MDANSVVMTGRMATAPIATKTKGGVVACTFRLANNGNPFNYAETMFFTVDAYGKVAEKVISSYSKGDVIYVGGKLMTNNAASRIKGDAEYVRILANEAVVVSRRSRKKNTPPAFLPEFADHSIEASVEKSLDERMKASAERAVARMEEVSGGFDPTDITDESFGQLDGFDGI